MNRAIEYFNDLLYEEFTEGNREIIDFFKKRGLVEQDIIDLQLGYIPMYYNVPDIIKDDFDYFRKINFLNDKGNLKLMGRILFPIFNINGIPEMVAARQIIDNDDYPKFFTVAELAIRKDCVFYGIDRAAKHIASSGIVIIVEGQMDVISLFKSGIRNVIAISGSSFSENHAKFLLALNPNIKIVFAFDDDDAGREAANKAYFEACLLTKELYVIDNWGDAEDPDDYATKHTDTEVYKKCSNYKPYIRIVIDTIENAGGWKIYEATKFNRRIISLCNNLSKIDLAYKILLEQGGPNIADIGYSRILKNLIKTFADAGKWIYNIYSNGVRYHRFLDRCLAFWWIREFQRDGITPPEEPFILNEFLEGWWDVRTDNKHIPIHIPHINEDDEFAGYKLKVDDYSELLLKNVYFNYIKMEVEWLK